MAPPWLPYVLSTLALASLAEAYQLTPSHGLEAVSMGFDNMLLKQAKLSLVAESMEEHISNEVSLVSFVAGAASSGILLLIMWLVFHAITPSEEDPLVAEKEGN